MSNPIKPTLKTEILPILLIFFSLISSSIMISDMPDRIPIHWNFKGEVDNWGPSSTHVLIVNIVIIGIYLLFIFLPHIDPRKKRYKQFKKTYHIFKNLLLFFITIIFFLTNLNAIGYNINISIYIPMAVGILFIIMGNYMGKIKTNWFMGIRTPWTLSSEKVWNKTHRLGGKLFILSGFLIAIDGLLPINWRLPIFILAIAIILIGTFLGSYLIYLKNKK